MSELKPRKSWPARPGLPSEARDAFAKVEPLLARIEAAQLLRITIDIPRAVAVAIGALPQIVELRDRVIDELPKYSIEGFDALGTYALASWHAHLLAIPAPSENVLRTLLAEAIPLRADLIVAAEALAHKRLLDRQAIDELISARSDLDTANDLVTLAAIFTQGWGSVANRTTVEWSDVERAAELGPAILAAFSDRRPFDARILDTDVRSRAFTLFARTYDEVRRAVAYLRWHDGDTDEIAPSLFTVRTRRRFTPPPLPPDPPQKAGSSPPAPWPA